MDDFFRPIEDVLSQVLKAIADMLGFLGGHRWAGAIFLLTIVVRTALLPLAIKQVRSSQAMQRLQPEVARLRQKHKDDRKKLNEEVMDLYRREGVSIAGGCLPTLAQMPVFIAMFYAIRSLSKVESYMPFFGLGNLAETARSSAAGIILLVIMVISQYFSTRQITAGQDPAQARLMRIMPLLFVGFMINFHAGLVLYWATSNVYALVQQTIMLRGRVSAAPPKPTGGKADTTKASSKPDPRPGAGSRGQQAKPRQQGGRPKDRPKSRPPVRSKPRSKKR